MKSHFEIYIDRNNAKIRLKSMLSFIMSSLRASTLRYYVIFILNIIYHKHITFLIILDESLSSPDSTQSIRKLILTILIRSLGNTTIPTSLLCVYLIKLA